MIAKKLILTTAFVLSASLGTATVSLAQSFGPHGQGYYNYGPGPGPYNNGPQSDCNRGGPGPRVGCGSGMGIGSQS